MNVANKAYYYALSVAVMFSLMIKFCFTFQKKC